MRKFEEEREHWLDQGHGSCLLREPEAAAIVAESLRLFRSAKIFDRLLRRDAQPRARAVQATWGTLARGHFALVEIIHRKRAQSENESRGSAVDARKLRHNCPRRRTFARVPGVHCAKSQKSPSDTRRICSGATQWACH